MIGLAPFVTDANFPMELHNFGIVFFWMPFYAIGHLVAHGASVGTSSLDPTVVGLQPFHVLWLRFADFWYAVLAAGLLSRLLRGRGAGSQGWLVGAILFGTPWFAYAGYLAPGVQSVTICLACAFVLLLFGGDQPPTRNWVAAGAVAGMAMWVATLNVALLAALPALLLSRPSWHTARRAILCGAVAATIFLPQALLWRMMMGRWTSPYSEQLAWDAPRIFETLFSSYNGLFFVSPLLLLAVAGLLPLWRRRPHVALATLLVSTTSVYIGSINIAWWAGGSFGARYTLGALPFLALSLHALWQEARARGVLWPLAALALGSVAWSWSLLWSYRLAGRHLSFYYTPREHLAAIAATWHQVPGHLLALLLQPDIFVLLCLPLFLLLSWPLVGGFERAGGPRHLWVVVPLLCLLSGAALLHRSARARDACQRDHRCATVGTRANFDAIDWGSTLYERAVYHAKRGEEEAACRDLALIEASPVPLQVEVPMSALANLPCTPFSAP